jgi:hypothetical protein
MPQQIHVIDAVCAGDHPHDQRDDLRCGVRAALRPDPDPIGDQPAQPAPGRQRHHRRQPRARHEIRIIKPHRHSATSMK